MPLRALLFDFDGLILDTETADLVSWEEVWTEHGQRFPIERYLQGVGTVDGYPAREAFDALEALTGPLDQASLASRRSERKLALIEIEELRPGVLAWLEMARARAIKTAIVSSSSRGWVDGHLERLEQAGRFDVIVTGDHDRSRGKPAPTLYLEALAALDTPAAEAVAFEDSPNGIRAARGAGVFCVAVSNRVTAALDLTAADLVVASLADLSFDGLLARFGGPSGA